MWTRSAYCSRCSPQWAGADIVLTQTVGDRFDGIQGLALTVPIAAATAAVIGVPQAVGHLDARVILTAVGLALLLPVIPYALEMLALRRMTHNAFGTLMALEPAFGVIIGAIVLQQWPTGIQVLGIVAVVTAGAGAQRGGTRSVQAVERGAPVPQPPSPGGADAVELG